MLPQLQTLTFVLLISLYSIPSYSKSVQLEVSAAFVEMMSRSFQVVRIYAKARNRHWIHPMGELDLVLERYVEDMGNAILIGLQEKGAIRSIDLARSANRALERDLERIRSELVDGESIEQADGVVKFLDLLGSQAWSSSYRLWQLGKQNVERYRETNLSNDVIWHLEQHLGNLARMENIPDNEMEAFRSVGVIRGLLGLLEANTEQVPFYIKDPQSIETLEDAIAFLNRTGRSKVARVDLSEQGALPVVPVDLYHGLKFKQLPSRKIRPGDWDARIGTHGFELARREVQLLDGDVHFVLGILKKIGLTQAWVFRRGVDDWVIMPPQPFGATKRMYAYRIHSGLSPEFSRWIHLLEDRYQFLESVAEKRGYVSPLFELRGSVPGSGTSIHVDKFGFRTLSYVESQTTDPLETTAIIGNDGMPFGLPSGVGSLLENEFGDFVAGHGATSSKPTGRAFIRGFVVPEEPLSLGERISKDFKGMVTIRSFPRSFLGEGEPLRERAKRWRWFDLIREL